MRARRSREGKSCRVHESIARWIPTYSLEVRLLEADIEEPQVLVKLDLGRHLEIEVLELAGWYEKEFKSEHMNGFELYGAVPFQGK